MAANPTKPPSVLPGAQGRDGGLRGRLWVAFVLQIAAISVATLLSVYGAWVVLRDVLIQNALMQEAQHYWVREHKTLPTPEQLAATIQELAQ